MTPSPSPRRTDPAATTHHTLAAFADVPALNRWLYSKLAPQVRGDVLEIGSGIGNISRLVLADARRLVLTDVEPAFLDALRACFTADPRVSVARYDLAAPPPPEVAARRYETVLAVNVLEHIADDLALVATLAGLLAPGGNLVVYVPACPFAFGTLDRALGHHRRYTPDRLTALLRSAGLRPGEPRYLNLAGLVGWWASGRLFRRVRLAPWQLALFERLLPLVRLEDRVRLPIGLGLYVHATK